MSDTDIDIEHAITEWPTLEAWFMERHLHDPVRVGDDEATYEYLYSLETVAEAVDLHCVTCGRSATFHLEPYIRWRSQGFTQAYRKVLQTETSMAATRARALEKGLPDEELQKQLANLAEQRAKHLQEADSQLTRNRFMYIELACSREPQHRASILLRIWDGQLTKVGQYPPVADLRQPELERFRRVLSDDKYRELHRAVGLSSHDVHIGAFVYLRRVFEYLVDEAWSRASAEKASLPSEEDFRTLRMEERIAALHDELPSFMVRNRRRLYGLLSNGVHNFSEEACAAQFSTMYRSIRLVLEQRLAEKRQAEETRNLEAALQDAGGRVDRHD